MKKLYTILSLLIASTAFFSCSDDEELLTAGITPSNSIVTKTFAEEDESTPLKGSAAYQVRTLLKEVGEEVGLKFGIDVKITDAQYKEIKEFTDKLVADCATDDEKFTTIFNWVTKNITYQWAPSMDAYDVFINKAAVCTGYSNLTSVMLISQNIPCVVVHGLLHDSYYNYDLGHSWNYAYHSGKWWVVDATNNRTFNSASLSDYADWIPQRIDAVLYEDEFCTYHYNRGLSVCSFKPGYASISIPFGINGHRITAANPYKGLANCIPAELKEIYIGKNITTLGDAGDRGLFDEYKATNIEGLYVDPENEFLLSHSNAIYSINSDGTNTILGVALAVKHVELLPIETFDKETPLKRLPNLETVTFVPGTKFIGDWCIEECPKLHTVYAANETEIAEQAFVKCADNLQIIRGNYTNIPSIR